MDIVPYIVVMKLSVNKGIVQQKKKKKKIQFLKIDYKILLKFIKKHVQEILGIHI